MQSDRSEKRLRLLDGEASKSWAVRDFVMCGLPLRHTPGTEYTRQNGRFTVRVVATKNYGLPYGADRLLPIWLATAWHVVGRPADGRISLRSAADLLRAFDPIREPNGTELRRVRERIERIYHSTFFVEEVTPSRIRRDSYRLIASHELWFDGRAHGNQHTLWGNVITLDARFVAELQRKGAIPIDLRAVSYLRQSPLALDLYCWQALRSFSLLTKGKDKGIPLFGEQGLCAQFGITTRSTRRARQLFRAAHARVKAVWDTCPNELAGDALIVRPGRALPESARLTLPGVRYDPPGREGPKVPHLEVVR